jgi:hypothetical protein
MLLAAARLMIYSLITARGLAVSCCLADDTMVWSLLLPGRYL